MGSENGDIDAAQEWCGQAIHQSMMGWLDYQLFLKGYSRPKIRQSRLLLCQAAMADDLPLAASPLHISYRVKTGLRRAAR